MDKISVAVLLSGREQFSVYYGGATARWTYDVYSRLQDRVDATIYGFPTDRSTAYPLPHDDSGCWRTCNLLRQTPLLRRYEDHVWVGSLVAKLEQFSVVHIHNRPQWAGLLRSFGYRGLIVLHLHNDHVGHWTGPMLDNLAEQIDGLVVCSKYLGDQSSRKSAALGRKTRVVHNGVNTSLFFPRPEVRDLKTILFVGSFIPSKGPLELIRAYAELLKTHPDTKLIIAGGTSFGLSEETPYVGEVRALAESLQRQFHASIEFPGYIHHDRDLPALFQRATLFTSPSIFQEPFGIVNAEAMACATPVVGSNRGGIPEVLGNSGLLVNPEEITEYADALSGLLSDPDERMRLGSAALERVRKMFDWKTIARTWLRYLQEVTGQKVVSLECA